MFGGGSGEEVSGGEGVFVPAWGFGPSARLSEYKTGVEFGRYAVPPGTLKLLESLEAQQFGDYSRYLAAQCVGALCLSADRLDRLPDVEKENRTLRKQVEELTTESTDMQVRTSQDEDYVRSLEAQIRELQDGRKADVASLSSLKAKVSALEEEKSSLEANVLVLQEENSGLRAQVDSLLAQQAELVSVQQRLDVVNGDLAWLLGEGIVSVVDRVFELQEFSLGVQRYHDAVFVAGEDAGRRALLGDLKEGKFSLDQELPVVDHEPIIRAAEEDLATLDYGSLLGFGRLDVVGLRELCKPVEDDAAPPAS